MEFPRVNYKYSFTLVYFSSESENFYFYLRDVYCMSANNFGHARHIFTGQSGQQ